MKKSPAYFFAALLLCLLALTAPAPAPNTRTVQAAEAAQDKCTECQAGVQARYEQCLAQFGDNNDPRGQRCHDQFNEGIVHCFRHFCEQ